MNCHSNKLLRKSAKSVVFANLMLIATFGLSLNVQAASLCKKFMKTNTPRDLRIPEHRFNDMNALRSLKYLEATLRKKRFSKTTWERFNLGVPNHLRIVQGSLLRKQAILLNRKNPKSQQARMARQRFCDFVKSSVVRD